MPGGIDMSSRVYTHVLYGVICPTNKIRREQPERQAKYSQQPPRFFMRLVPNLDLHELWISTIELDSFGEIDDFHKLIFRTEIINLEFCGRYIYALSRLKKESRE